MQSSSNPNDEKVREKKGWSNVKKLMLTQKVNNAFNLAINDDKDAHLFKG